MAANELPVPSSAGVSNRMSRQRRRDTEPEVIIRKLLHAWGLRFRVTLPVPGMKRRSIDIAFPRAKVAVFVDGCFWHVCPEHQTSPAANSEWWATKLAKNQARDVATTEHLRELGWTVVRIWEHEDPQAAAEKVRDVVRGGP
ncbi:very short patch repair endonuclease [Paractinoplanes brasiliensis]|uniref:T/G mismatch-specific endonuclease n=1 Tax=Paractinoplanes brasiliensis TaxID=52695 RepID=A0A4R6JUA6_9ACTN|nr:very short patch repair endonuclease [Actinoplanes brasiliensis]TDO39737.1 T/G mismatch-specific endonuclease [Actinoplanes brasiliensis]